MLIRFRGRNGAQDVMVSSDGMTVPTNPSRDSDEANSIDDAWSTDEARLVAPLVQAITTEDATPRVGRSAAAAGLDSFRVGVVARDVTGMALIVSAPTTRGRPTGLATGRWWDGRSFETSLLMDGFCGVELQICRRCLSAHRLLRRPGPGRGALPSRRHRRRRRLPTPPLVSVTLSSWVSAVEMGSIISMNLVSFLIQDDSIFLTEQEQENVSCSLLFRIPKHWIENLRRFQFSETCFEKL